MWLSEAWTGGLSTSGPPMGRRAGMAMAVQETGEGRPRQRHPFCVRARPHGPGAGALRIGQEGEFWEAVLAAHACALLENRKDSVSPGTVPKSPA